MNSMLNDAIIAVLWCLSYILVIYSTVHNKISQIPMESVGANLACEFLSAIYFGVKFHSSFGLFAYVIWFLLDVVIVFVAFNKDRYQSRNRKKIAFVAVFFIAIVGMIPVFLLIKKGFFFSTYIVDLFMETCWLFYYLHIRNKLDIYSVLISATKLFGDALAWLFYAQKYKFVSVIGPIIFMINAICLFVCCYYFRKNVKKKRSQTDINNIN